MTDNAASSSSAVFFDLDGTILDWQADMESTWLAACADHCDGASIRARREGSSGVAPIA